MTPEEAIQQLEFDRAMILFDSLTGEEITPEMLKLINKENYLTYVADGIAIKALEEIQQYREIGTVEECRMAAEKQKPRVGIVTAGKSYPVMCPSCGHKMELPYHHCIFCGQNLIYYGKAEK